MKNQFLVIAVLLFGSQIIAQSTSVDLPFENNEVNEILKINGHFNTDSTWAWGGTFGINLSQVYLNNWAAGGLSSVSATGLMNTFANFKKGKSSWDNTLDMAYGMLWQGDRDGIKADDKLDLASKYGYDAGKHWFYTALLNFRSQFAPGYADPYAPDSLLTTISDFLSPAYALAALGMDYKPNENFTFFISPATAKITIVKDQDLADAGAFGVTPMMSEVVGNQLMITPGENIRSEFGGYIKTMYKTKLAENVAFQTKLDLFSNYQNNPQNIDVNWENLLAMKINEFLTTTISTQVLYDHDISIARDPESIADGGVVAGPATQFKETLTVGFSYAF